jgi:threonine dehydrogenase-like Zn-dependent dehydrogenase
VGCGALGLLWTQILTRRGDSVSVVDPRAERLERALHLGASRGPGDPEAAVLTAPAGLNAALESLSAGGTLLVFAAPSDPLAVNLEAVYRNELRVIGSRSATPRFFDEALAVLPSLSLPPLTLLPLERFREGVDLYRRGEALKVAFTP